MLLYILYLLFIKDEAPKKASWHRTKKKFLASVSEGFLGIPLLNLCLLTRTEAEAPAPIHRQGGENEATLSLNAPDRAATRQDGYRTRVVFRAGQVFYLYAAFGHCVRDHIAYFLTEQKHCQVLVINTP
jgi:hypothetical protein